MIYAFFLAITLLVGCFRVTSLELINALQERSLYVEGVEGDFLFSRNDEMISMHYYHMGQYEKPFKDLLLYYINEYINDDKKVIFIDIGANVGLYTIPVAKALGIDGGTVYAIEPQRQMFMYLQTNILLNKLDNVLTFNFAITNVTGYTQLDDVESSTKRNYGAYSISSLKGSTYTIPTYTLDHLLENKLIKCPNFMKIDIESMEPYVFMGGRNAILECKPILLVENNCKFLSKTLIVMLDNLGYTVAWIRLPTIDFQTVRNLDGMKETFESSFGAELVVGDANILAVPKKNQHLLDKFPEYLIKLENGKFYSDEYNNNICLGTHWCKPLKQRGVYNETTGEYKCGNEIIPQFTRDYWMRYE